MKTFSILKSSIVWATLPTWTFLHLLAGCKVINHAGSDLNGLGSKPGSTNYCYVTLNKFLILLFLTHKMRMS